MPFRSRAQQGYMHAAAARGEIPESVVGKFDRATSARQYAHLPEHVFRGEMVNPEHDFRGGEMIRPERDFRGALVERYFGGGKAGEHHHGYEHDEHGSYMEDGGHVACQHFAHGGVSASHDPECPHHPMYGGGFAGLGRDDEDEDVDEPEVDFERDEERFVHEHPRGGELRHLAEGGEAGGFDNGPVMRAALKYRSAARQAAGYDRPHPPPAQPDGVDDSPLLRRPPAPPMLPRRYALGGEAEDETQRLQGSEWEDERNAPRSKFAEHLSGARVRKPVLSRILRAPGTRVP